MSLSKEEITELKNQLKEQIKHLSGNERKEAEKQIEEMSEESIDLMVSQQKTQKIFRMIANKEIESVTIKENDKAIAVLEINPLSRGHTLIIPKQSYKNKNKFGEDFAVFVKEIVEKIEKNMKAKKVHFLIEDKLGEIVGEIIPEYDLEMKNMKRKQMEREDLEKVKKEINREVIIAKKETVKEEKKEPVQKEIPLKLKRKIP
ncbi:MAG: HIT domain-containing protein [Nanoarchaeota archaeon]